MRSILAALVLLAGCQQGQDFVSIPYTYQQDTQGQWQKVPYQVVDGHALTQGDILLGDPQAVEGLRRLVESGAKQAVGNRFSLRHWAGARIPYVIDPKLPNPERVHEAIQHYHEKTIVRFHRRRNEGTFLYFTPSNVCASQLGKGFGRQKILLSAGCGRGSVIHEMGHALGLWHEQSRWDRDDHIKIHWDNLDWSSRIQFYRNLLWAKDLGPYDYDSVMHYDAYAFSRNGKPTITRRDGSLKLGNRAGLSPLDIKAINRLYR